MNAITQNIDLGDGRQITIETGKLAKQADGSVIVRVGDTMLLATVVSNKEAKEDVDFMPLSVDYQEKYASTGRFPGGFFKREARPSEHEILTARLVDRALRPLFPEDYHAETQVLIYLISAEKDTPPEAYAALAASSALAVSNIPFNGPISEVCIARVNGEFVVNPSFEQLEEADLELMIAANMNDINMVEGEMKEVSEEVMMEALKFAHEIIKKQIQGQLDLAAKIEKANPKREYCHENNDEDLKKAVWDFCYDKVYAVASEHLADKHLRSEKFGAVAEEFIATIPEEELDDKKSLIKRYFHDVEKAAVRNMVLDTKIRLDGRKTDEIRPIWCEIDYLPSAHGSAVFTRGETQSLTTVTLGTKLDEQTIDGAVYEGSSNFLLHYNFPPFSVGEARFIRGTSRREVGHGNLALRALKNMIVRDESNPYTIRVVSDILESNGSSSMATVCAGSLAMMDAGVHFAKPVSGIAMGLITDQESGKYAILSDILGDEDHLGDMDFKVTGTIDGITACQMDIKVDGLSYEILAEALEQAKRGRHHILGVMNDVISAPRDDYKENVPRYMKFSIPKEFIGAVIGPGGKIIQELQKETETTILIEEVDEFGIVDIFSTNKEGMQEAHERIKKIVAVPEIGEVYEGKVVSIVAFGAFVEVLPGKEGLLHISEIAHERIKDVKDVLKVGQMVKVKLKDIDSKSGKMSLSRKALLPKPEGDNKNS
ncbi:MAG: polyribonucleotide nucleotidyltransferase [Marinilabiliales bacterium]|nr:MAG: polyribonucleotide nucleotidyltransferase [Marinilabiliales bacterium]